jgi:hypothetical protein
VEITREMAMMGIILSIIRTRTGGMDMAVIMTSVIPMEVLERVTIKCITTTRNENKP